MGGIFSTPSPAPLPPPPPPVDPEDDTVETRKKQLDRQRRGRIGTIATSFRGVLQPRSGSSTRKSLLGE